MDSKRVFNPYLPEWEYVPDGEPHIFNNRVWGYGSHDRKNGDSYCLEDYVVWSAPTDDLSNWTCSGTIFKKEDDPYNEKGKYSLFAPDIAKGPDGRYYLYYFTAQMERISVAVSERPDGRFRYYGDIHYPDREFTYGGVIVSNADVGYNGNQEPVNYMANNHGGMVCIENQWYMFYHRHTHKNQYSRQGCAEKIQILPDGKINQAVMRILRLKNKLGLFEDPYRGASAAEETELFCCEKHRAEARKTAQEAMVLLKNEGKKPKEHILPLKPGEQKIALIGPYADSRSIIGLWAVHADTKDSVTLKEAFEEVLGKENLITAKGCEYMEDESVLGGFGNSKDREINEYEKKQQAEADRKAAFEAAAQADVVVMALGEHPMQSGEGGSRTDVRIPEIQQQLLEQIYKTGKPVILIIFSGRPLVLTDTVSYADAVLEAWFPGTEGAHAAADIIFGKANPSGRLTMSFPYTVGQIPVYYNGFQTGRPVGESIHSNRFTSRYLDCPNKPLYPFGYGLSYHETKYTNMSLSQTELKAGEILRASVDVENISSAAGQETVQMYIRDVTGSVVRPVKELRGFQKILLKAGETKRVFFEITESMLRFHTKSMKFQAEPGKFIVMIGKNSEQTECAEFFLKGEGEK